MKLVEKEVKRRLNEFHFVTQYLYTRFCQANAFTGRLCERIIIDMKDIHKDIEKFNRIGRVTIDYLLSEYGEAVSAKKERFESVIRICDLYLRRMNQIILAAKQEAKNKDDRLVIQKCDITLQQGLQLIEALKELKNDAIQELKLL